MELKELKREVEELPNIEKNFTAFLENWFKPLKRNTFHFLKNLDQETKKELNKKLIILNKNFDRIKSGQVINEKLRSHARQLIELKLTTFNDNRKKSKIITNRLLNDDYLNIREIIMDINEFGERVKWLRSEYNKINELLQQNLSLEDSLLFADLPHNKYLSELVKTADRHKEIVKHLGKHFVSLAKETRMPEK